MTHNATGAQTKPHYAMGVPLGPSSCTDCNMPATKCDGCASSSESDHCVVCKRPAQLCVRCSNLRICKGCNARELAECEDCTRQGARCATCLPKLPSVLPTIHTLDRKIVNAIMFKAARLGLGNAGKESEMVRDLKDGEDHAAFMMGLLDKVHEVGEKREEEYAQSSYPKRGKCHGMPVVLTPWADSVECLMEKRGIEHGLVDKDSSAPDCRL